MRPLVVIQSLGVLLAATSVYAVGPELVLPSNETLLSWLQSAGFPAWAGIVAWGVMRITTLIREISDRVDTQIGKIEQRISYIEARLDLLAPRIQRP